MHRWRSQSARALTHAFALWLLLSSAPALNSCHSSSDDENSVSDLSKCLAPRDVVFLIDQSGSMQGNDKQRRRWQALQALVRQIGRDANPHDRLALIPFGSKEDTRKFSSRYGKLRWYQEEEAPELIEIIERWRNSDSNSPETNIHAAFKEMRDGLLPGRADRNDLYVFLITDGQMALGPDDPRSEVKIDPRRSGKYFAELLKLLKRQSDELRLYAICLGRPAETQPDSLRQLLAQIQHATGVRGLYFPVFSPRYAHPEAPFLLLANTRDDIANFNIMKNGVAEVLSYGMQSSPAEKRGEVFHMQSSAGAVIELRLTLREAWTAQAALAGLGKFSARHGSYQRAFTLQASPQQDGKRADFYLDFTVPRRELEEFLRQLPASAAGEVQWQFEVKAKGLSRAISEVQFVVQNGWQVRHFPPVICAETSDNRVGRSRPVSTLYLEVIAEHACAQALSSPQLEVLVNGVLADHYPAQVELHWTAADEATPSYGWILDLKDLALLRDKFTQKVQIAVRVPAIGYYAVHDSVAVGHGYQEKCDIDEIRKRRDPSLELSRR